MGVQSSCGSGKKYKIAVAEINKVRSLGNLLYLEIEYGIIKLIINIMETYSKR